MKQLVVVEDAWPMRNSAMGNPRWKVLLRDVVTGSCSTRSTGVDCAVGYDVQNQLTYAEKGEPRVLEVEIRRAEVVSWRERPDRQHMAGNS